VNSVILPLNNWGILCSLSCLQPSFIHRDITLFCFNVLTVGKTGFGTISILNLSAVQVHSTDTDGLCFGWLNLELLHCYSWWLWHFPCSSPVDMQSYELCCDMIDVVIDISCIYGWVTITYLKPTRWQNHTCTWRFLQYPKNISDTLVAPNGSLC